MLKCFLYKEGVLMEKIISYDELPYAKGQSVYLRMETDPKLYVSLISKGYRVINVKILMNIKLLLIKLFNVYY